MRWCLCFSAAETKTKLRGRERARAEPQISAYKFAVCVAALQVAVTISAKWQSKRRASKARPEEWGEYQISKSERCTQRGREGERTRGTLSTDSVICRSQVEDALDGH